jgi:hypothetical protein
MYHTTCDMKSNLIFVSEYGKYAELRKWCFQKACLCRRIAIDLETLTNLLSVSHLLLGEYLMSALLIHFPQASPSAANALLDHIGAEQERTAMAPTLQRHEKPRHASYNP